MREGADGIRSEEAYRTDSNVLADVLGRLTDAYDPDLVYLFGSAARGEVGPNGDYDLLIVVPDDAPPEKKRSRLAYEVLWRSGIAVDPVVCTLTWFEERRGLRASLPGTVLREGRRLYPG